MHVSDDGFVRIAKMPLHIGLRYETLNPGMINNLMPRKVWGEMTYPFPNFNGGTFRVCEWISNFIPHFDVFIYPSLRFKATLNLDCWLSDFHNFICITTKLNMPRRSPNVIRYRSYKNLDQSKFKDDLYVISEIMSCLHNDVNLCTRAFCEYLGTVIDLHCPLKTITIRHNNVPYMNADLRKLQYRRNMMRNLKNKNPNPENIERYRILRNKCVKLRLSSQRNYFEQRCDGGPKNQHFWPTIKPFITNKCKSNKDILLCENDNIINHPSEVRLFSMITLLLLLMESGSMTPFHRVMRKMLCLKLW